MKKKSKIILFIVLFILFALIVLGIVINNINSKTKYNPDNLTGNTPGNILNGGLFAELDGKIYFSNPYDGGSLCVMDTDLSNAKTIYNDCVKYINVCDNYIFYIRYNYDANKAGTILRGNLYGIVRITPNGKNLKLLSPEIAKEMCLYGNNLIYDHFSKKAMQTYYLSIDGESDALAFDGEFELAGLYNGYIFYSGTKDDHNVYMYNIATKTSSVYIYGNTYKATMIDGYLYYLDMSNNYALTRKNVASGEESVIANKRCFTYNVYGDKVFYATEGDAPELHRCDVHGNNDEFIASGVVERISCTSTYTFFNFYGTDLIYSVPTFGSATPSILFVDAK